MKTQNISHRDKRENARTLATSGNYEIPHGTFSKQSGSSAVTLNPSFNPGGCCLSVTPPKRSRDGPERDEQWRMP